MQFFLADKFCELKTFRQYLEIELINAGSDSLKKIDFQQR